MTKALVGFLLLIVVACSSTTRTDVSNPSPIVGDASVQEKSGKPSAAPGDTNDAVGVAGPGGRNGGGAGTAELSSGSRDDSPAAVAGLRGTLKLGVHLSANGAAAAAFGVALPAHSPAKVDAILKWINANGGIGGRRV